MKKIVILISFLISVLYGYGVQKEIYRPKTKNVLSSYVVNMMSKSEKIPCIVYFTDKEYGEIDEALKNVNLADKAVERRLRNGIESSKIVKFQDVPVSENYINQLGVEKEDIRAISKWFNFVSAYLNSDDIERISELPFVYGIDTVKETKRDEIKNSTGTSNSKDNYGGSFDELEQINLIAAHTAGYKGQGVLLMMDDSGFNYDHEVFETANVVAQHDFINDDDNVKNEGNDPWGQHDHGTSCWSLIGANLPGDMIGGAYEADFLLAKTEDISQETTLEEDFLVEALEWGEGLGADIVSGSLGYTEFDDPSTNYTYEDMNGQTCISTLGVLEAARNGVLCVYAMGNSGNDSWHYISAPADTDSIISVGAVDIDNNIAGFSSYGPSYDGRIKPEVVALGVYNFVANADGGYNSWGSGTSYATPLVAAASAVVLSAHPDWTAQQIREALMMTADRSDNPSIDRYGYGLIDVMAAINYQPVGTHENTPVSTDIIKSYPNPFNPETTIEFAVNDLSGSKVNLSIYNSNGELMTSLIDSKLDFGTHTANFNAEKMPSGVYFCKLTISNNTFFHRMVLLK